MSIEAGGNAPFIVFDDADIDAAVEGTPQSSNCLARLAELHFLVLNQGLLHANSEAPDRRVSVRTGSMYSHLYTRNSLPDWQRRWQRSR